MTRPDTDELGTERPIGTSGRPPGMRVAARKWGRIGGLRAWALNPPERMVGPAHRGFRARFERQVTAAAEANGETLTTAQIAERADRARRAYMLTLAALSADARRRRAAVPEAA